MVEWIGSQACDLYLAAGIHGLGACYSQGGTYVLGLIVIGLFVAAAVSVVWYKNA